MFINVTRLYLVLPQSAPILLSHEHVREFMKIVRNSYTLRVIMQVLCFYL